MSASPRTIGRTVMHGARATALGFVVRFGARILFLYLAARLFGAALFGAYALATAAVELAVAVGGIGSKRLLFKHLDEEAMSRRGTASNNPVTPRALAYIIAGHELHHVRILRERYL